MIKRSLKAMRGWRPLNAPATAATRSLSRVMGRDFESAIKHLPRTGPVRSELPNGEVMRLWSRGDDWISNQVFWRGWDRYEPETTPLFFRLAGEAEVVLDIGAYVGFFSILAALANRRSQVLAFEPMPDNAERLRRHIDLNGIDNVEVVEAAVSDVAGSAAIFDGGGDHPCSTSLDREFIGSEPGVRSSLVRTIELDSFLAERKVRNVDLIKIDIETAEPNALRGMEATLERDHPTIVCEVLTDAAGSELRALLAPLGFRFHHLTPEGPVEREEITAHPEWLNWLFSATPEERINRRRRRP